MDRQLLIEDLLCSLLYVLLIYFYLSFFLYLISPIYCYFFAHGFVLSCKFFVWILMACIVDVLFVHRSKT